ncbi:hypothetical protein BpHYR1_005474 [Brachionus plicatilis]|uniref:Uncharacterized protein n=1 Tax=Brachionus plicatilis TaxID=10195 RepID=A0A3M7S2T4_BRAPC|nr:hypothetical protein BpHYR1_005474 [Brachionus plicatilis]
MKLTVIITKEFENLLTFALLRRQIKKIRNPDDDNLDNEFDCVESQLDDINFQTSKYYESKEAFSFGLKIGDGSEESHFIANCTSLKLLESITITNSSITNKGVYYVDARFKIRKK